jgi:hypothetical protein
MEYFLKLEERQDRQPAGPRPNLGGHHDEMTALKQTVRSCGRLCGTPTKSPRMVDHAERLNAEESAAKVGL